MGIVADIISLAAPAFIALSFIILSLVVLYSVRSLKDRYAQHRLIWYAGGAALLIALAYLYFYFAYSDDALAYMVKALIAVPLVFFLPGFLIYRAFLKDHKETGLDEFLFLAVSGSILTSGLASLILAEVGLFSLLNLLIIQLFICLLILWKIKFNISDCPIGILRPDKNLIVLALIALLAATLFFHPYPWVLGGRDQGVYVNTGVNIANTGSILIHDALMASLKGSANGSFYSIGPGHTHNPLVYEGVEYPGFYITNSTTGAVTPQFFFLWPVWIGIFYSIFGLSIGLYVTPFFALLSIIGVYLVGKTLFSGRVGLIASFLSTLNFAFLWYSREPTSEIFTMFLILCGLLAFIYLSRPSTGLLSNYFAIISALCIGEIFLTRIDMVLLLIPLFFFLAYLYIERKFTVGHALFIALLAILGLYAFLSAILISRPYTLDIIKLGFNVPLGSIIYRMGILLLGIPLIDIERIMTFDYRGFLAKKIDILRKFLPHIQILAAVLIIVLTISAYFLWPHGDMTSDSYNLVKLSWYMGGFFGILLACLGCILIIYKKPYPESYLFLSIFLIYSIFYLFSARIAPDQPWWVRRYLPVVIPMALMSIAYFIDQAYERLKAPLVKSALPVILVLLLLIPAVASDIQIVTFMQFGHSIEDANSIAKTLDENSITLCSPNYYTEKISTPLHYIYGKNVTSLSMNGGSFDQIQKWISLNRTVYLMDVVRNDDICTDKTNFSTYNVSWTVLENNSWQSDYYFYVPYAPQLQQHTYYISALRDRNDLNDLVLLNESNWYGVEHWDGTPTRWETNNASVAIYTLNDEYVTLTFNIVSFYQPRTLRTYLNGALVDEREVPSTLGQVSVPLHLAKGFNDVTFNSLESPASPRDIKELNSIDSRTFSFAFQNLSLQRSNAKYI